MALRWWIEQNPDEPITAARLAEEGFSRGVFLAARQQLLGADFLREERIVVSGRPHLRTYAHEGLSHEPPSHERPSDDGSSHEGSVEVLDFGVDFEGVDPARALVTTRVPENSARGFDAWWAAYPNKVGKRDARAAYDRAMRRGANPAALLEAVASQQSWARWLEGYVPNPATWLNQDRWDDEPPPVAQPRAAPQRESNGERMARVGQRLAEHRAAQPREIAP